LNDNSQYQQQYQKCGSQSPGSWKYGSPGSW
jgi:hypothetical protein